MLCRGLCRQPRAVLYVFDLVLTLVMPFVAVRFLGVGKVSAKLLVASLVNKDVADVDLHKLLGKMMRSSKVSRAVAPCDFRVSLPGNAGFAVDMHIDGDDHCFIAVTPPNYPRRLISAAGEDTPCLMNGQCAAWWVSPYRS